jgi:hypothetical protein
MRRLVPLLFLLAACGSSHAVRDAVPVVVGVTSQSAAGEPTSAEPTSDAASSAIASAPPVGVVLPASPVTPIVPTRQAPTHAPSPAHPPCCKGTSGGSHASTGTVSSSPVTQGPASLPATGPACAAGQLVMAVSAESSGPSATFTATLTNQGSRTCTVTEGASTPDLTVTDSSGTTVWTRGCDPSVSGHTGPEPCPMYARLEPLAPGASQTWTQGWDGTEDGDPVRPAQPGSYVVHASAGASGSAAFTLS